MFRTVRNPMSTLVNWSGLHCIELVGLNSGCKYFWHLESLYDNMLFIYTDGPILYHANTFKDYFSKLNISTTSDGKWGRFHVFFI